MEVLFLYNTYFLQLFIETSKLAQKSCIILILMYVELGILKDTCIGRQSMRIYTFPMLF